jgi:hypothetical protein
VSHGCWFSVYRLLVLGVSCCAAPAASAWFSGVCFVLCLLLVMTAVPWPLGAGVLVFFFCSRRVFCGVFPSGLCFCTNPYCTFSSLIKV